MGHVIGGYNFNITIEEAWEIWLTQNGECALSGVEIKFSRTRKKSKTGERLEQTASLDRIDSSKGYSKENCQWVHKLVNRLKGSLPENDFYEFCKSVYKKLENKYDKTLC
jgi:hypothetical protein